MGIFLSKISFNTKRGDLSTSPAGITSNEQPSTWHYSIGRLALGAKTCWFPGRSQHRIDGLSAKQKQEWGDRILLSVIHEAPGWNAATGAWYRHIAYVLVYYYECV